MPPSKKSANTTVDRVFATPRPEVQRFSFDQEVVSVFPDMIKRSVPGYATIIDMIGILAARYAQPNTHLYDLGCSLGAASFAMARMVSAPGCKVVAVDNSAAMIARARDNLAQGAVAGHGTQVEFVESTLQQLEWQAPASMAVLNFTLQFVPLAERKALLQQVADTLVPGGILVLSEKICFADAAEEALQQSLYYAFKRNNGYSELEISQKREALEDVLLPETIEAHRERLLSVGFSDVKLWFHCFNFCSMIAIR